MIHVIVFSKDRACQLDALLRSFAKFFTVENTLDVLYTASAPDYQSGYDRLIANHPGVAFHKEQGFRDDSLRLIQHPAHFTMFLVDDIVMTARFEADDVLRRFESDPDVLCLSLRLGKHITYTYTRNEDAPVPTLVDHAWDWRTQPPGSWDYPMSVDGHIYRTADLDPYVRGLTFHNPNTFELAMSQQPVPKWKMVCYDEAKLVNLPLNLVQTSWRNRHGQVSQQYLNRKWLKGRRIRIEAYENFLGNSTHCELPVEFETIPSR